MNFNGGNSILWLIAVLLLIACAIVFLWINIDISESAALR